MNAARYAIRLLITLLLLSSSAPAARLHFEQSAYAVTAGETLQVRVLVDMDEAVPGDQIPSGGLFSMGVRVTFSPSGVALPGADNLVLPAELNGNGLGGLPEKRIGPDYVGAAGAIAFESNEGYQNPLMLTVNIADLSPGTYSLGLGLLLDGTLANFVDFATGAVLDAQITNFVSATVVVQSLAARPTILGIDEPVAGVTRIICASTNVTAADVTVEGTHTLVSPGVSWGVEPGVSIVTNAPGLYAISLPTGAYRTRFYRISLR